MSQNLKIEVNKVSYADFNNPAGQTTIQGTRGVSESENGYVVVSLVGQDNIVQGLIYEGPLKGSGNAGMWHNVNFPRTPEATVINTSCYGPNNGPHGMIQLVESYKIQASTGKAPSGNLGFFYEGPVDGSGAWVQVSPNGGNTNNVFVHSIMGGLAVGNYDVDNDKNGYAFLYDIVNKKCTDFKVPDSLTTTLYGIWHNGGDSYTMAGGYTSPKIGKISQAFLVDYNSKTKQTSNLKSFNYKNETVLSVITHFEGITISKKGGYNMPSDWLTVNGEKNGASFVAVSRNSDGSFGEANWVDIDFPNSSVTSANTVYRNNILGIYAVVDSTDTKTVSSFVAKVNIEQ
ncbi:hypothetical protein [Flavobacterium sp. LM4]|uniref:hypothetical protein n=1 Tax=Flavobacterium sp. LM4 TaxID=1938609 RepID=UPI0009935EA4|nr:hypothetical protein [Flavobacterium sp. LM4]OOV17270.1 hypothetical protein BXU10_14245 [Flavobacterium sp. LM4]